MKKTMLMAVMMLIGAYAEAGQVIALRNPHAPALANLHWGYCAADGFTADGTLVTGVCQYSYGTAPRYRSSPTASYHVTWNLDGSANSLASLCNATDTSGRSTIANGCVRNYQGTGSVVMVNGVPLYYVGTNSQEDMLANSNVQSYLVLP